MSDHQAASSKFHTALQEHIHDEFTTTQQRGDTMHFFETVADVTSVLIIFPSLLRVSGTTGDQEGRGRPAD